MIELLFIFMMSGGEVTLTQQFDSARECNKKIVSLTEIAHNFDYKVLKAECKEDE